jgi:hypothetical protein
MTTTNSTTPPAEKLQDTAKWLREGRKGLDAIKRIEAGTIDESIGSVPVGVTTDGDHLLSLCENDSLWIMPNGTASEAFKDPEIMPSAKVAMLYRFFWPMLVAEVCDLAKALDQRKKARKAAYVERVLSYSRDDDPYPTMIELLQAPNCEPSILSHPPRIVRDAEGFQRLELKGADGWSDQGVVEEVTRLAAHGGLVLVATDAQAFLMTAQDFDNPAE